MAILAESCGGSIRPAGARQPEAANSIRPSPRPTVFYGLEELAEWIHSQGLPAITGLIVDKWSDKPGHGYFSVFQRPDDDTVWWDGEIVKAVQFDWLPFVSPEAKRRLLRSAVPALPPPINTPQALDLATPPPRVETTIYRVLRDSAIARQVKALHGYKCQFCGDCITLSDGSKYAESHHLKPLGEPHNGPDVVGNVMCVCPNCHVRLDYEVIAIELANIATVPGQQLATDCVRWHNEKIYRR